MADSRPGHGVLGPLLPACAALLAIAGCNADPASPASGGAPGGAAGGSGTGGVSASGGTGGAGQGGRDAGPVSGSGGAASGGAPGTGGGSGPRDAGPTPDAPPLPPPPGQIALTAIPGNSTVGLDWTRDSSATGYRVYWSTSPGVTPETGQRLDSSEPALVHRGLTNGTRYHYLVTTVSAAGEGKRSNEVQSTPGGEWVLEELGAGDFTDVLTGGRVARVPVEKRVQVLLLPEGYLAGELGIFHAAANHNPAMPANDVDRWIKEVFELDPYSKFREAFVIWYLPRPSATHTADGGSAFADPAAALWTTLDGAGPDAFPFPPTAASRNFVASFLMFDPARGRAGVSGHTSTCPNPADRNLTLRCAFGIGHAHEFTHAFSDVRDEYLEDANTRTAAAEAWSNVNGTNRCDELPWAHLLAGRGINRTESLVGAFGRPERGYHSELKCHMNGTHENGKYWCASGMLTLRPSRFCNFCRELTTFRVLYRTGLLAGSTEQAFNTWKTTYRSPFFARFGFNVPTPVPQTLKCDGEAEKPVYEACVP